MTELCFTVPGKSVPWQRAGEHTLKDGRRIRFTPKKSADFRAVIQWTAKAAGAVQMQGPLDLEVVAVFDRPKRLMRRADPDGLIPCEGKRDWDNIGKQVSDALQGVCYANDAQITDGTARKRYAEKGGMARLEVRLRTLVRTESNA